MKLTLYLLFLFVCLVVFTKAQSPQSTEAPVGVKIRQMVMSALQARDDLNKKDQDSTITEAKGPIDCENPVWPYTFKCNGLKMRDNKIAWKMSQMTRAPPSKGAAGPAN